MKPHLRRYFLLAALALIATVAGALFSVKRSDTDTAIPRMPATTQLLSLTLPNTSAINQPLSQWQGKLLVVNFWATWCTPCLEEMSGFSRLQEKFSSKGVQFVGIAIDSADKVQQFSIETPVSYPLLIGSPGLLPILSGLGNQAGGLPFTVVIGRDGSLLQSRLGVWKEAAFDAILADLTK